MAGWILYMRSASLEADTLTDRTSSEREQVLNHLGKRIQDTSTMQPDAVF